MAWLYDPIGAGWIVGTVPGLADFQHIEQDVHTWGGNVNAGTNSLTNLAGLQFAGGASGGGINFDGALGAGLGASNKQISGAGGYFGSAKDLLFNVPTGGGMEWDIQYAVALSLDSSGNFAVGGSFSATTRYAPFTIKAATDVPGLYLAQSNNDAGGWMFRAGVDGNLHIITYQSGQTERFTLGYAAGNLGIGIATFPTGLGNGIALAAGVAPTANPSSGHVLYVDPADSKLKARGSSGTITVLALP